MSDTGFIAMLKARNMTKLKCKVVVVSFLYLTISNCQLPHCAYLYNFTALVISTPYLGSGKTRAVKLHAS